MKRLMLSLALVLALAVGVRGASLPNIPDGYEIVGIAPGVCPSGNPYVTMVYEDKNGNAVLVHSDLGDNVIVRAWHDSSGKAIKLETIDGNEVKSYGTHEAFYEGYPNAGCGILDARVRNTI